VEDLALSFLVSCNKICTVCCTVVYINNNTPVMKTSKRRSNWVRSWLCEKENCNLSHFLRELKETNIPDDFKNG